MQARIPLDELNRELEAARASVEAWADAKVASAGELRRKHAQAVDEHKSNIACLRASQQGLAHEADQVRQKLAAEDCEQAELDSEVGGLEAAEARAAAQLQALQGEVSGKAQELAGREADLAAQQDRAAAKLEHLRAALALFSERLGLRFERSEDVQDELRLVFSALDPAQPERQFVVGICVQPSNTYEVTTCQPPVAGVGEAQRQLNESGNFGRFVQAMRAKFRQLLAQEAP